MNVRMAAGRLALAILVLAGLTGCGPASAPRRPAGRTAPPAGRAAVEKRIVGPAVAGFFYPRHERDLAHRLISCWPGPSAERIGTFGH